MSWIIRDYEAYVIGRMNVLCRVLNGYNEERIRLILITHVTMSVTSHFQSTLFLHQINASPSLQTSLPQINGYK